MLRGGVIFRNLREMSRMNELSVGNVSALADLIHHVTSTVEAYNSANKYKTLTDFPVVNKNILRDNIDRHMSSVYQKSKLAYTTTSGSTGTPFRIYFDKRKIQRHRAALMYWNERAGAPLGQRLYYLRVWNNINKKGRLAQLIENIIPIEVSHFGEIECNRFLQAVGNSRAAILGFSSALIELARYAEVVPSNISGIIAMSEHLPESVRDELSQKFNCSVYARYSNMENGFIAQQFDESGEYLINTADFIVEVLHPDRDEPVADGELGRIVVTDLYNYAMPFIRYDTGDMGVIRTRPDGRRVLASVEGRKCDIIYDTENRPVSSHVITNSLWAYPEIVQYQFIQNGKASYILRLNMNGHEFNLEDELKKCLKKYLGDDAVIDIEYVDGIPVLNSGKRRYIVNEYHKG